MSDLLFRMNNSVQMAEAAAQATYDILTGPLDVPVNVNGIDAPTLATRVRDYMTGAGGLDGEDGKSLEFIEIRQDGHLWAKIEDQPEEDLGQVVATGIDYVQYDDVTGELEIALTDGQVFGPYNVKGDSASDVQEAFIRDGNLWLGLADGTEINAGDITRFGGAGANDADITEAGDLVIIFTDGSVENVGRVRGDKGDSGVSLVSAGIDQFGVLRFLRSDGRTATAGLVNATILDSSGNTVVDVRLGGVDNKELLVELESTTLNLGKVVGEDGVDGEDGDDGVGISAISTNEDRELIISLTDGTQHNAGPLQVTRVFNAGNVSIGTADIVNGELIIEFDLGGTTQTINLGNVMGDDGTILSSAEINSNSHLVFTDSEGGTIDAGEIEQATITAVEVNTTGHLEVTLSDGTSFTSTDPVRGEDGVDADGIESVYIQDGNLWVSYEGGSLADANLGRIVAEVETDVSLVDGRDLTFTMSDGQTFGPFNVRGDDGIYLTEARIEEGRVYVTYSNDTNVEVDIGKVEQDPVSASINEDGTLTIDFDDGTSLSTTERVQAFDGDTITNIEYDEEANALTIDYTTGNRTGTDSTVIDNIVGYGMTGMRLDEVDGTPTIVVSTNIPGYEEVSFSSPKGEDGASIIGFEKRGDDLVIKYQERGEHSNEKEFVAEDIYSEGSIESITVNGDGDLVIDVDILPEPLVFPTITGADGNTITNIELVGVEGRDLLIETRDDGPITIPNVRGKDGVSIESIEVDGTDLVIKASDREETLTFEQKKGIDAQEAITGISLGGAEGRDLIIEKTSETLTVPLLRGEDGITITNIEIVGKELVISVSDGNNVTFDMSEIAGVDGVTIDNIEFDENDILQVGVSDGSTVSFDMNDIRGVDGKSIESVSLGGDDGRDLIITTNLDAPEDVIAIPGVKGEDGATVQSIDIDVNGRDFTVQMSDGSTSYTLTDAALYVVGARIDDRKLVIELSDGTEFTSSNDVVGRDGNGTGVVDVVFNGGKLTVTLVDAAGAETDIEAGDVSMVGVSGARIEEDTLLNEGILWIDLEDGSSIEVGNVFGENGRFVTSVDLIPQSGDPSREDLVLTFNDGSTVNAGNATGNPGRSVVDGQVAFGGDMIIEYSDGTFDNIGNVGTGAGLSIWDSGSAPYVEDQVVIHEGGLYMSLEGNNNDQPPSDKWVALALGDQVVQIRKPVCLSPVDGATAFSTRPRLTGSVYAPIVSIDERDHRTFEIDVITGDFSSPVYRVQVDSDVHEITGFDLNVDTDYKWRIRDVSKRGDMSEWSDEESFNVPANIVETPSVSIHPEEDVNDAFIAPEWQTSAFSMTVGTETHQETDWQIRNSGGTIVWEKLNSSALTSVVVDNDVLVKGESYEIRAKHRGDVSESGWSDWAGFTVSMMDYAKVPSVVGDSETFQATPFEKTDEFAAYIVGLDLNEAIWTIVKVSDGSIVEQEVKTSDMRSYTRQTNLESDVTYRITVEYVSDRFGSVVSDGFEFEFVQFIETPTISTEEDINEFPSGGVFTAIGFVGVNDSHVSTDWEVRDFFSDELLWSSYGDTENLESVSFAITSETSQRDLKIRVRYNGEFVSSEWSEFLDFYSSEVDFGLGPDVLLAGDMETEGFFGEVPVTDLFSGDELASLIGLTAGTSQHSTEPWLKFVIDGEIIYVAKKPYRHTVSWDNINDVNAVYNDENAPIVEKDGYQFRVTLMTGGDADPASEAGGEWNRLIYRVHQDDPSGAPWASYSNSDIVVGSGDGRVSWTQETSDTDSSRRVVRGTTSLVLFTATASDNSASHHGWRPALRLVV